MLAPLAFVGVGMLLRLSFSTDIEFKSDERGLFDLAHAVAAGAVWPWIGPGSSIGAPEPAMTDWILGGLAWLTHPKTPPDLARDIQVLNILALALFAASAFVFDGERRRAWLWAAALWAANPNALILERKIWHPSLFPLPMVLFLLAWRGRKSPLGAFAWGVLGAMLGQIHPTGGYFALAVAAWTFMADRKALPWLPWLAGSLLGAAPAVPWLLDLASHAGGHGLTRLRLPILHYFLRFPTRPFGMGIDFTLGKAFPDFLAWPKIGTTPTFLMAGLHLLLGVLALWTAARALSGLYLQGLLTRRNLLLGRDDDARLINAALWGLGGIISLMTLGPSDTHPHYLEIVATVMALWLARLVLVGDETAKRRRAGLILPALCAGQLALSAGLLIYIDQRQAIPGDYGVIWRAQTHLPPAWRTPTGG